MDLGLELENYMLILLMHLYIRLNDRLLNDGIMIRLSVISVTTRYIITHPILVIVCQGATIFEL